MIKRLTSFAVLSAAVLALGACGSDSESEEPESNVVGVPEATADAQEHFDAITTAVAEEDCELLLEETFSQLRAPAKGSEGLAEPGAPASKEECAEGAPAFEVISNTKGAEFEVLEENGTAAIGEGETTEPVEGYELQYSISIMDRDGQFRNIMFFPADPQDQEPDPDADPLGIVEDGLIPSVRSGDCKNAEEIYDPLSRFAEGKGPEAACESLNGGSYFAPSVKETPPEDIEVELLVHTFDIAVVGVATKEAYYSVLLLTPPTDKPDLPAQETFQVTDVLLSTEAKPG